MQLPAWFVEEPLVPPFGDFFLRHFWVLDTERPQGWTAGRIPESRVADYGYRLGLDADMIDLFTEVIMSLDRDYMAWITEKRKKEREKSKG